MHHSIDMLAGNGAIESFSSLPRLLRDSIVIENWEGTHNTLRMQILRDIHKYHIDEIYLNYMDKQLSKIGNEKDWLDPINIKLKTLNQDLIHLKKSSPELQSLRIRDIVDQMALLSCALNLFLEGRHQEETANGSSKLNCLRYFYLLHFQPEKPVYDEAYVKLISEIVADRGELILDL